MFVTSLVVYRLYNVSYVMTKFTMPMVWKDISHIQQLHRIRQRRHLHIGAVTRRDDNHLDNLLESYGVWWGKHIDCTASIDWHLLWDSYPESYVMHRLDNDNLTSNTPNQQQPTVGRQDMSTQHSRTVRLKITCNRVLHALSPRRSQEDNLPNRYQRLYSLILCRLVHLRSSYDHMHPPKIVSIIIQIRLS